MDILIIWLVVGLSAGMLASLVMGGSRFGVLGDVMVGVAGAFLGGWIFDGLGWRAPIGGLAGTAMVAFLGAVIVLLCLRLFKRLGDAPVR